MLIAHLIESIPGWQNKTAEEIYSILSTESIVREDNQNYTWAGVATICGEEAASALYSKLEELGKRWAILQLGGTGLSLSHPEIQQQLYYLDSIGVPNMAILAQHVRKVISPLENAGIQTTLEEIDIVKRKRVLEDAAMDRLQTYREALSSWNGTGEEPVL